MKKCEAWQSDRKILSFIDLREEKDLKESTFNTLIHDLALKHKELALQALITPQQREEILKDWKFIPKGGVSDRHIVYETDFQPIILNTT